MRRSLRVQIRKAQIKLILGNPFCRNTTIDNLAENTIGTHLPHLPQTLL
jgi:hypothetical protein